MDANCRITKDKKSETVKQPTPSHFKLNSPTRAYAVLLRSTCSSLELIANKKLQIAKSFKLQNAFLMAKKSNLRKPNLNFIACILNQMTRGSSMVQFRIKTESWQIHESPLWLICGADTEKPIPMPRRAKDNFWRQSVLRQWCCSRPQIKKSRRSQARRKPGPTPPKGGKFWAIDWLQPAHPKGRVSLVWCWDDEREAPSLKSKKEVYLMVSF